MGSYLPSASSRDDRPRVSGSEPCLPSPSSQSHQSIFDLQQNAFDPVLIPTDATGIGRHGHDHQSSASPTSALFGCPKPPSLPETTEQKKHRRTRSGCFTCRSRRVKCDERRPTCERCWKGKRECVYPPPQVKKQSSRASLKSNDKQPSVKTAKCESPRGNASDITTNERDLKNDDDCADSTQIDDLSTTVRRSSSNASSRRHWEPNSDLNGARSSSPSCGISQLNETSILTANDDSRASAPPSRHIGITAAAISPMLTDDDRLFLNFYLTQEYLGDWVNLMVHLKAACRMIKSLYRPEDMIRDDLHQNIFFWVTRIDVEAANILGKEPLLEKEWYGSMEASIRAGIQSDPTDLGKKWMLCEFLFRDIGRSMATLISQTLQDSIPASDFDRRIAMIHETEAQVQACMREINYILSETVESQASGAALSETIPGVEPGGGTGTADPLLIEITRFKIELKGINLLYQYHTGNVLQLQGRDEPTNLALELRQNIETICRCSKQPEDGLQSLQRSLTICVTFLPVDTLNVAWSRKMMAMAESQGYIFSQPLKEHLSARWSDPGVTRWWFPHGEGETQLLRETKEWAAEHSLGVEMTEDTTHTGTMTAR